MSEVSMQSKNVVRMAWISALTVAAAGAIAALVIRDQISRQQRNLFSPNVLRRFAALGYLARQKVSVDKVMLLRDYIAWERKPLLRKRAIATLERLEKTLAARPAPSAGI